MCNMARFLSSRSDRFVRNIRQLLEIVKEVFFQLEGAHDRHQLLEHEGELRKLLKLNCLSLTSLQRTIEWQESQLLWQKEGDAPTCFFHIHANSRHRRWFIHSLEHEGRSVMLEASKAEALFSFFNDVWGTPS
jgi:hypothetical protein